MQKFVISVRDEINGCFSVSCINCMGKWDAIRSMTKEPYNMDWMPVILSEYDTSIMVKDGNYSYLAVRSNNE